MPQRPFLHGYGYIVDFKEAWNRSIREERYGIQEELTDEDKDLISKFVGLPFSGHKTYLMLLRKRLAEKFPAIEQRLEKMTWDEVLVYVWDAVRAGNEATQPKVDTTCNHSPNFRSVTWFGQIYTFNPTQAKIIKLLWDGEKHQSNIAAAINSFAGKYRLIDSFRRNKKYHHAWRTMIKHLGQGVYTLAKPK